MAKIIELKAENIKRLRAIEITPKGNTVIIGGKNGAGKSSCLDAIEYALGGKNAICDEPIRKGQTKAKIVCQIDDMVVQRIFDHKGGSTLSISAKDGMMTVAKPQKMLDKLTGKLTFDPLVFLRETPKKQVEMLRLLLDLDFTELSATEHKLYEERRDTNREVKSREAQVAAIDEPEDGWDSVPDEELPLADVTAELKEAKAKNEKHRAERRALSDMEDGYKSKLEDKEELELDLQRLQERVEKKQKELANTNALISSQKKELDLCMVAVEKLKDIDTDPIVAKFEEVAETNKRVQRKKSYKLQKEQLKGLRAQSEILTEGLEKIPVQKQKLISEAKSPIKGLAFDDTVTFNEIPLSQCSSAEQLRVSVAIGLAMNPELKVLLIRDGSLLDDESLDLVAKIAAEHDAQVWIERVGEGEECQVIIEDGSVRENPDEKEGKSDG